MPVPFTPETVNYLKKIPYFSDFDDNALKYVAEEMILRSYEPGEILFLQGNSGDGLHLVISGSCRIYSVSDDGRERVLFQLQPGDYCNEVSAVDSGANPASCASVEKSEVWILTETALLRLRQRFPALNDIIIKSLANHARQLAAKLFQTSLLSVKQRLAGFLLSESDHNQILDRRQWPQDEIASYLGTVRDVVGRVLKEFREDGLIEVDRRRIAIKDKERLERLSSR